MPISFVLSMKLSKGGERGLCFYPDGGSLYVSKQIIFPLYSISCNVDFLKRSRPQELYIQKLYDTERDQKKTDVYSCVYGIPIYQRLKRCFVNSSIVRKGPYNQIKTEFYPQYFSCSQFLVVFLVLKRYESPAWGLIFININDGHIAC